MEKFDITKRYNKKEVLELDPLDLLEWVVANMKIKIPNQITMKLTFLKWQIEQT